MLKRPIDNLEAVICRTLELEQQLPCDLLDELKRSLVDLDLDDVDEDNVDEDVVDEDDVDEDDIDQDDTDQDDI